MTSELYNQPGCVITDNPQAQTLLYMFYGYSSSYLFPSSRDITRTTMIIIIIYTSNFLLTASTSIVNNWTSMNPNRPKLGELSKLLTPLVSWQEFGINLPKITDSIIKKIEKEGPQDIPSQKLSLFSKWLTIDPTASWESVISALKKANEHDLASKVEKRKRKAVPILPTRAGIHTYTILFLFDICSRRCAVCALSIPLPNHVASGDTIYSVQFKFYP